MMPSGGTAAWPGKAMADWLRGRNPAGAGGPAGGLATAAFEADPPDQVRALTREILSDPDFAPRQTFLQWLSERLSGLDLPELTWSDAWSRMLLWAVVIWCGMTLAAIGAHLVWTVWQTGPRAGPGRGPGRRRAPARPAPLTFAELAERMRRSAECGAFAEAIPLMMEALLTRLRERGVLHPHPGKTNGDYLREFAAPSPGRAPFGDFVAGFEQCVYGGRPCGAEAYAELNRLYQRVLADVEARD